MYTEYEQKKKELQAAESHRFSFRVRLPGVLDLFVHVFFLFCVSVLFAGDPKLNIQCFIYDRESIYSRTLLRTNFPSSWLGGSKVAFGPSARFRKWFGISVFSVFDGEFEGRSPS
jgi:hypothetical protein